MGSPDGTPFGRRAPRRRRGRKNASSPRGDLFDADSLLDSIGGIVWEGDPDTLEFRYVSRQAERLLGYPVELWLKEPDLWVRHLHPDDREWVPQRCREASAKGESHELEYRMIDAAGRTVWLRDIVTVVAEEGRPLSCRGVMVDVTARKRAEEALRVADERLRTVVANAPVVLFAVNREGVIETCVGRGLAAIGLTSDEIVGLRYADWARSTPQIRRNVERALAGQEFEDTVRFEGRVYVTGYTPLWNAAGEVDGVIGVSTDITDRARAEEERHRLEAQVQSAQRLESVGMLATGIAHDFNNFLTTIMGSAALLLEDLGARSSARDDIERIQRAARGAAELTNRLLTYAGGNAFEACTLDFSTLVFGMADLLRASVAPNAVLRFELDDDLPPVEGDAAQLTQVVLHLITNASEALGRGGGIITVRTGREHLEASAEPGAPDRGEAGAGPHLYLEVADTGCGMDAETRARIFEPFFTTKVPGRGLGLAAVLGIVRGHRGGVRVESEPGKGTVFRVLLPCSDEGDRL